MYVEYSANNSGGSWWLTDADWKALESVGWKVAWASLAPKYEGGKCIRDSDGTPSLFPVEECHDRSILFVKLDENGDYRRMGALATTAYRVGLSLRDAADEFDRVTSQNSTDAGCPCCGQPHNFTEYDDNGKYVKSGPSVNYECAW